MGVKDGERGGGGGGRGCWGRQKTCCGVASSVPRSFVEEKLMFSKSYVKFLPSTIILCDLRDS